MQRDSVDAFASQHSEISLPPFLTKLNRTLVHKHVTALSWNSTEHILSINPSQVTQLRSQGLGQFCNLPNLIRQLNKHGFRKMTKRHLSEFSSIQHEHAEPASHTSVGLSIHFNDALSNDWVHFRYAALTTKSYADLNEIDMDMDDDEFRKRRAPFLTDPFSLSSAAPSPSTNSSTDWKGVSEAHLSEFQIEDGHLLVLSVQDASEIFDAFHQTDLLGLIPQHLQAWILQEARNRFSAEIHDMGLLPAPNLFADYYW
jgi:hypothetical protein